MTPIQVNQRERNAIIIKSVEKTRRMTCQTHHRATILIHPTIVITDANNVRGRAIEKSVDKTMRTFNRKFADDII